MDKYNSAKYGGGGDKYSQSARADSNSKKQQEKQRSYRPTPSSLIGIPVKQTEVTLVYRSPRNIPGASKSTEEALNKPAPCGVARTIKTTSSGNFQNVPREGRSVSPPENLNDKAYYQRPCHNYSPMSIPASESQHARLDREGRVYFPPGSAYRYTAQLRKETANAIHENVKRYNLRTNDTGYFSGKN